MTAIVRSTYRYKRPPKKRKPNPAALAMPAIVRAGDPVQSDATATAADTTDRKSLIVTVRRRKAVTPLPPGLLPETPEEHRRRGEAADAMWREMVRRVASKDHEEQAS
jgi:hypothetical protein